MLLCFLIFSNIASAQFINYQGHATIRGIATAPDQTIWANAGNGLLHYDLNGDLIEIISRTATESFSTPTSTGTYITVAPNGDIWTASGGPNGSIKRYDGNSWTTFSMSSIIGSTANTYSAIEAGPDRVIYALSYGHVSVYQNDEWQSYNLGVFSNGVFAADFSPTGVYFVWLNAKGKRSIPQKLIK